MNNFKDFDIKPRTNPFVGEKIPVKKILNAPILVHDYKIGPSKQKADTECLTIQIEKNGEKRIVFTSSGILMDQIKRVPRDKFPFNTVIKGDNDYFEFT